MPKFSLKIRLLLSHLLVMAVGLGSYAVTARVTSHPLFVLHLETLSRRGAVTITSTRTRAYLVEGFQTTWNRTTLWSIVVGATAAGGLSYWLSRRIVQPLQQMEDITQKFADGELQERLPNSEIPELHRLSASFNRMAASLEGVEQRRRELISDLTHELRTPLTVVHGYLEELGDGRLEASPGVYMRLSKETRRLERLVNDLQELSQAEAGYLPIHLQKFSLSPLLASLVQRFADQLLEEGPSLELNCPKDLPLVQADRDRTEQILVNLLGNALRHTEIGKIVLTAKQQDNYIWVRVSDTGSGIAKEDLPHVFERFWRGDRSRSSHSGGTGIGLAITRRLVELQGGQIRVSSRLGEGTTFEFSLPVHK